MLALVWAALSIGLVWFAVAKKAPAVEDDVRARASAAVKALNADAEVKVDGRFVTVRGPEPDAASKARTLKGADEVWGALGPFDGLWIPAVAKPAQPVVVEAAELAAPAAAKPASPAPPGFFQATRSPDGAIVATGDVPNEAAKASLLATFKAGGAAVVDRVALRADGLGAGFDQRLTVGARALASLAWGRLVLDGDRATLTGAGSPDAAEIKALGGGWTLAITPVASPAPVDPTPAAADGRLPQLEADLAKARSELAAATSAANACQSQAEDVEARLQTCAAQVNVVRTEFAAATSAAETSKARAGEADSRLQDCVAQANVARTELAATTTAAKTCQSRAGETDGKLQACGSEITVARTELATATTATETCRSRAGEAESKLEACDGQVNVVRTELAAAKSAAETYRLHAGEADGELRACAVQINLARTELAAATSAAEACRSRAGEAESGLQACAAQISAAKTSACRRATMRVLEGRAIGFATASADITPQGLALIDEIAREAAPCVKEQGLKVAIGGHTDASGDDAANTALSDRRAQAVRRALVERGVPEAFVSAAGYGESQPVADNATEDGRARNRRISFDWSVR